MRVLLRNRSFQLLIFGQTLSALGDRALIIAFGIWAKELTGSNAAAGVAFFFVALPYLFAPLAGVLIDRFSRRGVFIVANLVMAAVLFVCLLVNDAGDIWVLYAVTFCYGVSGIIIGPTQSTIISSTVDERDLPDANGLMQTITGGVRLLAPLVGAALFTVLGGKAVAVIDAVTFVVAALCVWRIRFPDSARPAREPAAFRQEMLAGLRHVFGVPILRRVVIALGATLLVMGFSQTLIFSIVDDGLHRSTAFIAVLVSVQGAGTIAAGLGSGALTRRFGDVNVVTIGIGSIAGAALLYLSSNVFVVAAGALWFGAAACWTTAGLITAVQLRTPEELKGRALATSMGAVSLPQTVSIALGAGLSLLVDYRILLGAMAVVTVGSAAWLAWYSTGDQLGKRPARATVPAAQSVQEK
ncbi:MFS transporter [Micromonospora sp. NPDC047074]|uniref:MFS transporter n=1 Tax=Micromonospora sp. NPDC047074 TaxID=3154339 RepID=UPI0033C5B429